MCVRFFFFFGERFGIADTFPGKIVCMNRIGFTKKRGGGIIYMASCVYRKKEK